MALDLPLPKQVFGHGWLVINGGKISKSLGNYKDPREYIEKYGVDAVRYFALREVPFGSDGNFSEEALVTRTNGDLVNVLGNLVNRTVAMSNKYFKGKIRNVNSYDEDNDYVSCINSLKDKYMVKMDKYEVNEALILIFDVLRRSNKYVDETTPWILFKEGKLERLESVLYNLLEAVRVCSILLQPFIPSSCEKIFKQLGVSDAFFSSIDNKSDFSVNKQEVLFQRIVS